MKFNIEDLTSARGLRSTKDQSALSLPTAKARGLPALIGDTFVRIMTVFNVQHTDGLRGHHEGIEKVALKVTDEELAAARTELSAFVADRAAQAASHYGFSYAPDPMAPSTYADLRVAFEKSTRMRRPLPVSSLHCNDTIYDEPEDNIRFRFWHDTEHVRMGLSFTPADELVVAHQHLSDARDYGMSPSGLAYRLLQADTVANIEASVALGRFPVSGLAFALDCLNEGTQEAIRVQGEHLANQMAIQG